MGRIIVVGSGTTGVMAAAATGATSTHIMLLRKNEKSGKKIYIIGRGRCNLASAAPMREVQMQVMSSPRSPYSTPQALTNEDTARSLEPTGYPLKVEHSDRVSPVGDHISDVVRAFEQKTQVAGIRVGLHAGVRELLLVGEGEIRAVTGVVLTGGEEPSVDAVILATGGISYPATGSTGDSYRFAEATGMVVTERYPSLVPLILKEQKSYIVMQGPSLRNATITLKDGKKGVYEDFSEALFTHFGMNGSLLLSTGALVGPLLRTKRELKLQIDLEPAPAEEQLKQRLLREFDVDENRGLKNILPPFFPQSFISEVLRQSGISGERKARDITKAGRVALRQVTKSLRLTITGLHGYNEATVTKGGVSVRFLSPTTLEGETVKGLYLADGLLGLDAITNGLNLQIAWSTGILTGKSTAKPR